MIKTTSRGFKYVEFVDANDVGCSLQESSATGGKIWLSADTIGIKEFIPGADEPWRPRTEFDAGGRYVANNRMHLSRTQVLRLLPHLIIFVIFGRLFGNKENRTP